MSCQDGDTAKEEHSMAFAVPVRVLISQSGHVQFASRSARAPQRDIHLPRVAFQRRKSVHSQLQVQASASLSLLSEDVILQFRNATGNRRLARAIKPDGKRNWIVCDSNGVSHSITTKQVTFILGPSDVLPPLADDLNGLHSKCQARAVENEDFLQLVWEVVSDGGGIEDSNVADVEFVSDMVFSDTEPLSLYASHLLLSDDKLYFKERNIKGRTLYEARTKGQVEGARSMQEAETARREKLIAREDAFQRAWDSRCLDPLMPFLTSRELDILLDGLKSMAGELDVSGRTEARQSQQAQSAFQKLDGTARGLVQEALSALGKRVIPSAAMEVLVTWRVYKPHENLVLLNTHIPHVIPFSEELLRCAEELRSNPPADADVDKRLDLTLLTSFAIDSGDTTEVDDAISWDADTGRVLVHVADPARYFPEGPSHPVLEEVFRRVATLYLPDTKFTMFPESLANSAISLDGIDSEGCALTFGFSIAEDGSIADDSMSIQPTLISPPLRLTYEEVESILSQAPLTEDDKALHTLYEKARIRKYWREMEGGAIIVNSPFSDVKVLSVDDDEPIIDIKPTSTATKSWSVVSELMITACTVAADFAQKADIPVPFRGQEPFDYPEDEILESVPDGPARAALAFRHAPPSQVSTRPLEHASLGLDAYLQVTSPIRRTSDLLAHFQLKAFLRGEELPFSEEDVEREIGRSSDVARSIRLIESRTNRYWQLELLRRLGPQAVHDGTYVRQLKEGDSRLGIIQLDEYAFSLVASVPPNCKPGGKLKIRVQEVDPRTGTAKADAVLSIPQQDKEEFATILDDALSDVSSQSDLP